MRKLIVVGIISLMILMFGFSSNTNMTSNTNNMLNNKYDFFNDTIAAVTFDGSCKFSQLNIILTKNATAMENNFVFYGACGSKDLSNPNYGSYVIKDKTGDIVNFETNYNKNIYYTCVFKNVTYDYVTESWLFPFSCTRVQSPSSDVYEKFTIYYKEKTGVLHSMGTFEVRVGSDNSNLDPLDAGDVGNCSSTANSCSECHDQFSCDNLTLQDGSHCVYDAASHSCTLGFDNNYDFLTIRNFSAYKKLKFYLNTLGEKVKKFWIVETTGKTLPNDGLVYSGEAKTFNETMDYDISSWAEGHYSIEAHFILDDGSEKIVYGDNHFTFDINNIVDMVGNSEIDCNALFGGFMNTLKSTMRIFKIVAPIMVLILTTVEYISVIVNKDADALKKVNGKLIKRIVLMVALFFLPIIINLCIKLLLGAEYSSCF